MAGADAVRTKLFVKRVFQEVQSSEQTPESVVTLQLEGVSHSWLVGCEVTLRINGGNVAERFKIGSVEDLWLTPERSFT